MNFRSPQQGICDGRGRYNHCGFVKYIACKCRGQCAKCSDEYKKSLGKKAKKVLFPKKTGEYEVFEQITEERFHVCFVTGQYVNVYKPNGKLNVKCFAHVVSKGSRTDLRLLKKNIVIVLPRIHTIYDKGNDQERKSLEIYPGWFKLLELHDIILSENNRDSK